MSPDLQQLLATIAADRVSGASELVVLALGALARGREEGCAPAVAGALCRAQPAMAPLWNAGIAALDRNPATFLHWRERRPRALDALQRVAMAALAPAPVRPLRIVTVSMSATVVRTLETLHAARALEVVACAEGRPNFEGRRLATALAQAGVPVAFFTDAGVATALDDAGAVLVGADAVGRDAFFNKVGTRALAAVAMNRGVPVHVLATGDKLVMPSVWARLRHTAGAPGEIWTSPPAGVAVNNPYFEVTPLDLVTSVLTDSGALTPDMVAAAAFALETPARRQALAELLRSL